METKEYKAVPYNGKRIFVDESAPIKVGDTVYYDWKSYIGAEPPPRVMVTQTTIPDELKAYYKIIAQEYGCGIEGVPCVELGEEKYIDDLAKEAHKFNHKTVNEVSFRLGFGVGFEEAKSKGGHSDIDIQKAIAFGFGVCRKENRAPFTQEIIDFIASLKPVVKSICIEIDAEEYVMAYNQAWVNNPDYGKPKRYTKKIDGKDVELVKCRVNYE